MRRTRARRPGARSDESLPRLVGWVGASVALLIGLTIGLLPFREDLSTGTVALILVLPPLVAALGGRALALGMAVLGAVTFTFFFTEPYDSLRIDSDASIAAFMVYLIVTLALAGTTSRLRAAEELAERRAGDATLVQTLAVELIRNEEVGPSLRSSLHDLVAALGVRGAYARLAVAGGDPIEAAAGDADRAQAAYPDVVGAGAGSPRLVTLREHDGLTALPVVAADELYGFLVVDPGAVDLRPERTRVLESIAGVLALALGRAAVEQAAVQRRALEETDRLRAALLQSVSHDLRTPLTAIRAIASTLRTSDVPRARREELLADVEGEAERLTRFVSDLLELSRLESGALRPRTALIPVDELLHAAAEDARVRRDGRRIDVAADESLPPVAVDETMLRQALVNLLENAAEHDASSLAVRLEAVVRHGRLQIAVVDHGPGIPEAERRRVFEPYVQLRANGPGRRPGGSGLGLAIARGFVEAHGGAVVVEPTPGGGATFVVTLPVEFPRAAAPQAARRR